LQGLRPLLTQYLYSSLLELLGWEKPWRGQPPAKETTFEHWVSFKISRMAEGLIPAVRLAKWFDQFINPF
jgi:hypothetical protein